MHGTTMKFIKECNLNNHNRIKFGIT